MYPSLFPFVPTGMLGPAAEIRMLTVR
jgi:hypothetical protein